jgi:transposase
MYTSSFFKRIIGEVMARTVIDDILWKKLEILLPLRPTGGRPPKNNRFFIEAVCWIIRTGAPWRDLPLEYGSWKTIYNRYNRWCKTGEFDRILTILKKRWRSRMAYD